MPFDIPDDQWQLAKEEMRRILVGVARREQTVTYTEVTRRLTAVRLQPDARALRSLLDEVSAEEDEAGRGLLTAVVVHSGGDERPGGGFFNLARSRGRQGSDVEIWQAELRTVFDHHAG